MKLASQFISSDINHSCQRFLSIFFKRPQKMFCKSFFFSGRKQNSLSAHTEGLGRAQPCKEKRKSQNRNVLCSVVHVDQCFCLSYRMWKGFYQLWCCDPFTGFCLNIAPKPACLSLHCHSPPQKYNPPPPPPWPRHLSRRSVSHKWTHACTCAPRAAQKYLCSKKGSNVSRLLM